MTRAKLAALYLNGKISNGDYFRLLKEFEKGEIKSHDLKETENG